MSGFLTRGPGVLPHPAPTGEVGIHLSYLTLSTHYFTGAGLFPFSCFYPRNKHKDTVLTPHHSPTTLSLCHQDIAKGDTSPEINRSRYSPYILCKKPWKDPASR